MTSVLSDASRDYLAAVSAALSDLGPIDRAELLAEVEASLRDLELETESGPEEALGAPEVFAADLRSAAGLGAETADVLPAPFVPALAPYVVRGFTRATAIAHELAPIWWFARGFLVLVGLAVVARLGYSPAPFLIAEPAGHLQRIGIAVSAIALSEGKVGFVLIALATAASVGLGVFSRRRRVGPRPATVMASIVATVLAIVTAAHVSTTSNRVFWVAPAANTNAETSSGLTYNGQQVTNVYPFSRRGRLLQDVLLFTNLGQPIDIPWTNNPCAENCSPPPDPYRRTLRSVTGGLVLNAFPIRYFEPGTRTVAHPYAIPPIRIPRLATPPLAGP